MPSVRIWQKKRLVLDRLTFPQLAMFKVGTVGVVAVKNRLQAALGPDDQPAKPLTKRYAIQKTKLGKGNRRNLALSGDMLGNLQVRTVSENRARAGLSTRKGRIKAWANQKIQPWLVFSPKNKAAVLEATRRVFDEIRRRLVIERSFSGKQR
ncbi:MAG: hypothetical protein NTY38_27185 [Acidobacteria bacterium]|nr:hypothetical protein [Acidobacteriota bacterium]